MTNESSSINLCCNCTEPFKIADLRGLFVPLVLPECRHLCCETCIRSSIVNFGYVLCNKCEKKSIPSVPIDSQFHNLREIFPLSKFMSELKSQEMREPLDESEISFNLNKNEISQNGESVMNICKECNKTVAEYVCKECTFLFCNKCFPVVHRSNVFQNHTPLPINNSVMLEDVLHLDPQSTELKRFKDYLQKCFQKLEKVSSSLKIISAKDFIKLLIKNDFDIHKQRTELTEYFCEAQNLLSLLQAHAFSNLKKRERSSAEDSVKESEKELKQTYAALKLLINELKSVLHSRTINKYHVPYMFKKLEQCLKAPDTVTTKPEILPSKSNELKTDWMELMKNQCDFDFGECGKVYLVLALDPIAPINEKQNLQGLSNDDDMSIEFRNNNFTCNIAQSFVRSGSSELSVFSGELNKLYDDDQFSLKSGSRRSSILNSSKEKKHSNLTNSQSSIPAFKEPIVLSAYNSFNTANDYTVDNFYGNRNSRNANRDVSMRSKEFLRYPAFTEGNYEKVVISHVESPSSFFINRMDVNSLRIKSKFKHFNEIPNVTKTVTLNEIDKDIMYFAKSADGKWYRIRVLDVIKKEDDDLSEIRVILVDVGRRETLQLSNLRHIHPEHIFQKINVDPELAFECCLYECYPLGSDWKDKEVEEFKRILHTKKNQLHMLVRKRGPSKLGVDLQLFDENGSTSMRDFLIFSKQASMICSKQSPVPLPSHKDLKYFTDKDFRPSDWVDVKVIHINNPSDLYVKRNDPIAEKKIKELSMDMNCYYRDRQNYNSHVILKPHIGMAVVAKYCRDNEWYRGKIMQLKSSSDKLKAQVSYVDFGNTEWLHFNRIRCIEEDFTKLTIQVVNCSLSDIMPKNEKWTKKAQNFLFYDVKDCLLKMKVEAVEGSTLRVQLYHVLENKPFTCINEILIEEDFAIGIGKLSGLVVRKRSKQKTSEIKKEPKKKDGPTLKSDETSNDELNSSEVDDTENSPTNRSVEKNKNNVNLRINVLSCINPNLLYVSLVDYEPTIKNLMNNMLKFYKDDANNRSTVPENIDQDMKCAAYVNDDGKWYRAVIRSVENDNVDVELKDVARKTCVPKENIRTLSDEFTRTTDGAIRCHFAGIEMKSDWDEDVCENLRAQLTNFQEILLKKKGEISQNSLPVELWGKNVIEAGALEPKIEQSTNINELLMRSNFISSEKNSEVGEYEPPPEEILKKLDQPADCKENVKEWLKSSIVEATVNGVEYSEIIEKGEIPATALFSPKLDENFDYSTDDESNSIDIEQDWLPPDPLPDTYFVGYPTNIDMQFNIYVQLNDRQCGFLDIIENGLMSRYQNSPSPFKNVNWIPGQICICWYYLDSKWYRGKIKEVNKNIGKVLVEYVDYGNEEWVEFQHLRRNITLLDLPVQCYRLPLRSDCVSTSEDGKWPISVLDFAHATIVEKVCEVYIKKQEGEDIYTIEKLLLPQKKDLFELLYSLGHATCTPASKTTQKLEKSSKPEKSLKNQQFSTVHEQNEDENSSDSSVPAIEDVPEPYSPPLREDATNESNNSRIVDNMENTSNTSVIDPFDHIEDVEDGGLIIPKYVLPDDVGIVFVEVIDIIDYNKIVVHITGSKDVTVNENRKTFLEMTTELQRKAKNLPTLASPFKGSICCTKFEGDGLWYRALVMGSDLKNSDKVNIFYLDYGNVNAVDVTNLYKLKKAWYKVPSQAVRCVLEGVKTLKKHESLVIKRLDKMLLNKKFKATIKMVPKNSKMYSIKLMTENDSLPYQTLIDEGVLIC